MRSFTPEFEYFVFSLAAGVALVTYVTVKGWNRFHHNYDAVQPQWIIIYACSLQAIWGFSLIFTDKSDIAAWASLRLIPEWLLASSFLVSSALCYYALVTNKSIVWMLPQQGLMMISAMSCLTMVIMGHYSDGPAYPRMFILRDQLPEILTAIWHTCAIFHRERVRLWSIYHRQVRCLGVIS